MLRLIQKVSKKHNIMKTIILIFSLFILGCSGDDTPKEEPNNIPEELIGKWKIVEVYETDGGSEPQWREYMSSNSFHIWFKSNYQYQNTDGDENCLTGIYSINSSSLKYESICGGQSEVSIELLETNLLIIDFLNFEPYKHKYVKVSSENK